MTNTCACGLCGKFVQNKGGFTKTCALKELGVQSKSELITEQQQNEYNRLTQKNLHKSNELIVSARAKSPESRSEKEAHLIQNHNKITEIIAKARRGEELTAKEKYLCKRYRENNLSMRALAMI
jgi:hypothetical protein